MQLEADHAGAEPAEAGQAARRAQGGGGHQGLAPGPPIADNAAVEPDRTALIVPIPEAEPVVAEHRDRLDRTAAWGVPAHITVLTPFLPPAEIDERVHTALGQIAAAVPAFFLTLGRLAWFGERVLWLAPDPPGPFHALTAAVTARFPALRPYGGAFDEIVPHLTIGHDHPVEALQAAGEVVRARLPIRARAGTVRLITGPSAPGGPWSALADFPLG
jgi:2'-5' RNA ligase